MNNNIKLKNPIKLKNSKGDIINIFDTYIKRKIHNSDTEQISIDEISKVEILDQDELVLYKDDEVYFDCVLQKPRTVIKDLAILYEKINGIKYDIPKVNKKSYFIFALSIFRFLLISFSLATVIKKHYILLILALILILIVTIIIKSLTKDDKITDVKNFSWFDDFILTGNGNLLYAIIIFGILFFTLLFLSVL